MKRVVTDLVIGAHRENGLARSLEGTSVQVAVRGARPITSLSIYRFQAEVCGEFVPDGIRDGRSVTLEALETRLQRAFARGNQFAADRIVVA